MTELSIRLITSVVQFSRIGIKRVEGFGGRLVTGRTLEALNTLTSSTVFINSGMVAEGTAYSKHTTTTSLLFYLPTLF